MSEYIDNQDVPVIAVDDSPMEDAVPARKMFSSTPVGEAQYTEDNRGTSMAGIRAIAKYAKKGRLDKAFPKND